MSSETARWKRFLDLPPEWRRREASRFHVIPAPFEHTVSYGHGTADGPAAILAASSKLELFDGLSVPAHAGVFALPALRVRGLGPEAALARIEAATRAALAGDHVPVLLGGEHTVTLGAVRALVKSGAAFGIVQFDAHGDLRHEYTGTVYSHGCVMRRCLDLGIPVFQIGVRSYCEEEVAVRRNYGVGHVDAVVIARRGGLPRRILPASFPKAIYITFDVDALDPSLVPATGTPEPGGLTWYEALDALARIVSGRRVLAFDAVELAPVPGGHASDFTVAKLVYSIMGIMVRSEAGLRPVI